MCLDCRCGKSSLLSGRSSESFMSSPSPASLDEIVRLAEELPASEQPEFLRRTCGAHSALYEQAAEILKARSCGGWWDQSIDELASVRSASAEALIGSRLGPYRVIATLGEGGMGEVALAERADEQFSQRVAIKLVRRGITSRQVQGRLKLERQILATLDHPNIAKLLDGGTSRDGVPYIVMEYIDGMPVDRYCNERRLTVEERLRLFQVICSAVHYAHQNLIVHRDLKPSNILINADGVPKLLDFGIAKVLDERAFGHTLAVTHADIRLLTPEHASPEQVRGEPVSTASDTYVLGVLLYELLTGHKPYTVEDHRLSAIEHAICDQPPLPLPSMFVGRGSSAEHDARVREICEARSTSPSRLRRQLTGDLNNIVLTALRKEPERRYPSVEHFSADIDRYLNNMPIAARSDSVGYRARKFIRRHVFGVSVTGAAVVALISFALVTAIQARRIERERVKADQIASFLTEMFEQSDPSESRGNDVTVREILDVGAARIERELRTQPETGASLLNTIGAVYTNLGEYDKAVAMLERALALRRAQYGERNAEVADSAARLGEALLEKHELQRAEQHLQQALRTNSELFGERSFEVAAVLHSLARLRQIQEQFPQSRALFEQSLELLEAAPDAHFEELTVTLNDYAILLNYVGDWREAQRTFERAMQLNHQRYGADHPATTTAMHNVAVALEQQGKLAEAGPLFVEALATHAKVFGTDKPQYIAALSSYGRYLRRSGKLDEAERVLREAVGLRQRALGDNNYLVGYSIVSLAMVLLDQGRAAEAEREVRRALSIYAGALPREHLYVATALRNLGLALIDQQRPGEAEGALREALTIQEKLAGATSVQADLTRAVFGGMLLSRSRYQQAETLLLPSYPAILASQGPDDAMTVRVRRWVEQLFTQTGRAEALAPYLADAANSRDEAARQP
jgi:serine/threonine protein kinase/tetratricopeptide (TPR) repeat protein